MRFLVASIVAIQTAVTAPPAGQAAPPSPPPARPAEAIRSIIDACRTHDIVTVTDPHGNVQVQAFLLSLVRDPRFPEAVNDIVIETASARYQDAIDRFVRGEDVPIAVLRQAWENHTVPNSLGTLAEEFIRAVRAVNASLDAPNKLRVIAGDPPIDWDNIVSPQDHRRWIELRDSYPADLIRRQVLDRGRRALVIYGQGHLQRRSIVSNYDMSTWQAQTVVSLLERDPAVRLFNVWTLIDKSVALPDGVASWPVPSLAILSGTLLGAMDFAQFGGALLGGRRVTVRNGQLAPVPREDWTSMRMDAEFDGLLYLGPPNAMTTAPVPRSLCSDATFVERRLQRLARFGPPVEAQNFKKACGLD
jgi:hypothetical protein